MPRLARRFALIALAFGVATAAVAAEPFEIPFQPFETRASIEGRDVAIKVSGKATATDLGDALDIRADITADLTDLRAQIGAIVAAKMNRDDDCNEKLRVHTVDLRAEPPVAMLAAAAHYEKWGCLFGMKSKLGEQDGDVLVRVTPTVAGEAITLSLTVVSVDADGVLGALLRSEVFGAWFTEQIASLLPKELTIGRLRDALPAALKDVPAALSDVSIADAGNGAPAIRGTLRMKIGAEQMAAILLGLRK